MSTLFIETVRKAVFSYRQLLQRHLDREQRRAKLEALGLRGEVNFDSDVVLLGLANAIVDDIEANMGSTKEGGCYAYSGVETFKDYLKQFISDYEVEGDSVVHRGQRASRSLLEAIQLLGLPSTQLTPVILKKLRSCNKVLADYADERQTEQYRSALINDRQEGIHFYDSLLREFEALYQARFERGAVQVH